MSAKVQHGVLPSLHNHTIVRWAFATAAEFAASSGYVAADIGKVAYVAETRVYHVLRNHDPLSWDSLNESASVVTAEYSAAARTLTLTLENGTTVVATNVAVPTFSVSEFKLTQSPVEIVFNASAGPASKHFRVIQVPARNGVRINNFPEYDPSVNWEAGDVCRNGSSAFFANVLTTGGFNPAHWTEITDSAVLAYVNAQLALRAKVQVATGAPTASSDSSAGYNEHDLWLDIVAKKGYVATDVTVGAAVWNQFTPDIIIPWAEYNNGSDPVTAPEANFIDALALGSGAVAGATYAFAFLGNASGADGIAIGRLSSASDTNGIAIGLSADSDVDGVAVGNYAIATGIAGSAAFGPRATANGQRSAAFGVDAKAGGTISAALGYSANASANNSLALGGQTSATGAYSVACGAGSASSGTASFAIAQCTVTHPHSSSVSPNTTSWHDRQTILRANYVLSNSNERSIIAADDVNGTETTRDTDITLTANGNFFVEAVATVVNAATGEKQVKKFTCFITTDATTATIHGTVDEVSKETASLGLTSFALTIPSGRTLRVSAVHATDNLKLRTFFDIVRTSN